MNLKYIVRKRQLGDVLWAEPIIDEIALKYKKVIVHTKSVSYTHLTLPTSDLV